MKITPPLYSRAAPCRTAGGARGGVWTLAHRRRSARVGVDPRAPPAEREGRFAAGPELNALGRLFGWMACRVVEFGLIVSLSRCRLCALRGAVAWRTVRLIQNGRMKS
jgi:hypothetical protein